MFRAAVRRKSCGILPGQPAARRAALQIVSNALPHQAELTAVPLLIIDDLGMRKLPHTATEDLLGQSLDLTDEPLIEEHV